MSRLKRIRNFFNRYINGTRGAVSLLLILVMSPLLSVSVMLVESSRYQNAVQLMEEIMDSSAFSALAEYDPYLEERFGLLAVSQQELPDTEFNKYLNANIPALGESVTVKDSTATGAFPLSNAKVLQQQVVENGEITVATEALAEGFDLDRLMDYLKEKTGDRFSIVWKIENELAAVDAGIDVAKDVEKLIQSINDSIEQGEIYRTALVSYMTAGYTFESKALAYIAALKAVDTATAAYDAAVVAASAEEAGDDAKAAEQAALEALNSAKATRDTALTDLKTARSDYATKTLTLKEALTTLRGHIDTTVTTTSKLPEKLGALQEAVTEEDTMASSHQWFLDIVNTATEAVEELLDGPDGEGLLDLLQGNIDGLQERYNTLIALSGKESSTITTSWTADDIADNYGSIAMSLNLEDFLTILEDVLVDLSSMVSMDDKDEALMSDIFSIAEGLMKVKGVYDNRLDSVVSTSAFHTQTEMSFTSQAVITSITSFITAQESFKTALTEGDILEVLKSVVEMFIAVSAFLSAVVAWCVEFFAGFFVNLPDLGDNLLVAGYAAYNLPNRTNFRGGESLAGYKYDDIFTLAGGMISDGMGSLFGGSIDDLASFSKSGSDKMFKGAHGEYVLIGSANELENQCAAFFDLYMLRLLLDFGPVLKNKEATAMAAMVGPASLAVKIALIIAEPMVDTIFLVNGEDIEVPMIKSTVYLTPSGIPDLLKQCEKLVDFDMPKEETIKSTVTSAQKGIEFKGDEGKAKSDLLHCSYKEHLLLLIAVEVGKDKAVQRLQNLIQTESAVYYQSDGGFDLDKSHTYIKSNVTYTLNPMFHIDSLTEKGPFEANSEQYTGY